MLTQSHESGDHSSILTGHGLSDIFVDDLSNSTKSKRLSFHKIFNMNFNYYCEFSSLIYVVNWTVIKNEHESHCHTFILRYSLRDLHRFDLSCNQHAAKNVVALIILIFVKTVAPASSLRCLSGLTF